MILFQHPTSPSPYDPPNTDEATSQLLLQQSLSTRSSPIHIYSLVYSLWRMTVTLNFRKQKHSSRKSWHTTKKIKSGKVRIRNNVGCVRHFKVTNVHPNSHSENPRFRFRGQLFLHVFRGLTRSLQIEILSKYMHTTGWPLWKKKILSASN
jgi:hypothetical protein